MPVVINGSGTISGVSVGGLPDGIVDSDILQVELEEKLYSINNIKL